MEPVDNAIRSNWLKVRDLLSKGIVVAKYSHSVLNQFRSTSNKVWKFRKLTIKSNGIVDWQSNFISLHKVKKIKCSTSDILYSNELKEKSIILCTKKREIIFQFSSTRKRDSYLINLLTYLSLAPFDNIRCIPNNLEMLKEIIPIKTKPIKFKLKSINKPYILQINGITSNSDKKPQKSIDVNRYSSSSSNDNKNLLQSIEPISSPLDEIQSPQLSLTEIQCELINKNMSKQELKVDENAKMMKLFDAKLEGYLNEFSSKMKLMQDRYDTALSVLEKYKKENHQLKIQLAQLQALNEQRSSRMTKYRPQEDLVTPRNMINDVESISDSKSSSRLDILD